MLSQGGRFVNAPIYRDKIFISYSDTDQIWVRHELLPRLDRAKIGYVDQLYLAVGRSDPARSTFDELRRIIKASRWVLLIVTPSYLTTIWPDFNSILVDCWGPDITERAIILAIKDECILPERLQVIAALSLWVADESIWEELIAALLTPSRVSAAVGGPANFRDVPSQPDEYSRYEIGLDELLRRLGRDHIDYIDALTYQHRLIENIVDSRLHGNTTELKADRTRIVEQLNRFAISLIAVTFTELCGAKSGRSAYGSSAINGLIALADLARQVREVRDAVVVFQADFQATCEQIDILGKYKRLHDMLQNLEFCYNPIFQFSRRLPDDQTAWQELASHGDDLQIAIDELLEFGSLTSIPTREMALMGLLRRAQHELEEATTKHNQSQLDKAIRNLQQVLVHQPLLINKLLVTAAKTLRLPKLVKDLTTVCDHLDALGLRGVVGNRLIDFRKGVDDLGGLDNHLTILIDSHDDLQDIDLNIRLIIPWLTDSIDDLEDTWQDLHSKIQTICARHETTWAIRLYKHSVLLEQALATKEHSKVKLSFGKFHTQFMHSFKRADTDLVQICADLQKVGDPLALVLRLIQDE